IHSLPNPTCFNLLQAAQLAGQLCLEISPLIIYPIIDRLLGGSNADLFIPQRPLTQIEQRLVQRITDRATQHLSEAWSNLTPVTFSVNDFESNPQLVQIVPPNETVVVVGFELKMGNRAGTMSLCIPYNVIEPIMGQLSNQSWFSYQKKGGHEDHARRLRPRRTAAPGRAEGAPRAGGTGGGRCPAVGLLGYFRRAELPLPSLAFLLPLIVFYELGTHYILANPSHNTGAGGQRIIAFTLMQQFFNLFGVTGRYLPALAVAGILLTWHIARRDPWRVDAGTLLGMTIESSLLAIPLLAMGYVAARYLPLYAAPVSSRGMLVLSVGAGVYEELVFRLMAFTALNLLLIDFLKLPKSWGYLLIVLLSSVLFAAYHYLGAEPF